eukprot:GHRR01032503.1.p1 GENE.GHRR01032503.1~~GHRR01032503.1.p1  ORF type:complete len:222 (+),score=1.75 GHRR01032503.1:564-1229(+)
MQWVLLGQFGRNQNVVGWLNMAMNRLVSTSAVLVGRLCLRTIIISLEPFNWSMLIIDQHIPAPEQPRAAIRCLDLFSGTGSIQRTYPLSQVYSVDNRKSTRPTWCGDILEWPYMDLPRDHFDVIWASPCCTSYSCANTCTPKAKLEQDMIAADRLVLRTLEICNWFDTPAKPTPWYLENPLTGRLKDRPFMQQLPQRMMFAIADTGRRVTDTNSLCYMIKT